MKLKFVVVLVLTVIGVGQAQASSQDLERMGRLFEESFYSNLYEPRYCGRNIMRFVELAHSKGLDLRGAYIVRVENEGFSNFGLVKGYLARERGRLIREGERREHPSQTHHPGDQNWYMHVFLDYRGYIFDFDFTNAPRILRRNKYVGAMFLPSQRPVPKYERETLKQYVLNVVPASDYIEYRGGGVAKDAWRKLEMVDYLRGKVSQLPMTFTMGLDSGTGLRADERFERLREAAY